MSEQSYTHVTLRELRRVLSTRLGFDPAGDSADSVSGQLTEFIRAASLTATEQCSWVNAQRVAQFDSQAEQGEIPFPVGCGPGSILEVSVWIDDVTRNALATAAAYPANVFVPLERLYFGNRFDSDPLWEAGGTSMQKVVGVPRVWDVRDRILIRPLTDKSYRMKVLFTYAPELKCEDDRTVIDGELIVRYALVEYFRYAEEFGNADRAEAQAERRLRFLRGQQHSSEIYRYQQDVNLRLSPDEESLLMQSGVLPSFDFSAKNPTWDAAAIVTNPSPGP